ncbi:MAG: hypothetical protein JO001_21360 [Alphaproteobacteria bacterium]|nr:hypothetical protein [Alphaproteobacteria bacterium]
MVLGTDVEGKWHASRFDDSELALVRRAADLMGYYVVRVQTDNAELHALAEALPVGKIFASGKAFVPFVAGPVFQKLAPLSEGGEPINTERAAAEGPSAKMNQPDATTTADAL